MLAELEEQTSSVCVFPPVLLSGAGSSAQEEAWGESNRWLQCKIQVFREEELYFSAHSKIPV